MKIFIGSDHGGFFTKEKIKKVLKEKGFEVEDCGAFEYDEKDDYPFFAINTAMQVAKNKNSFGILLCRSGGGMAVMANKIKGVRAVECFDEKSTIHARKHNNANIGVFGADFIKEKNILKLVELFLKTKFSGVKRHKRRIKEIENFEKNKIEISTAIMENDLKEAERKLKLANANTPIIHIDFGDGKLIESKIDFPTNFFKKQKMESKLEAHLMVEKPTAYLPYLKKENFSLCACHIEVEEVEKFLRDGKKLGFKTGIVIDLPTKKINYEIIKKADYIIVMGVKIGKSGQKFNFSCLNKITDIKDKFPQKEVAVDGGMQETTIEIVKAGGATRAIANSYFWKKNFGK